MLKFTNKWPIKLEKWFVNEDGAVTVDMVILIAGVVAMALAAIGFFSASGSGPVAYFIAKISNVLQGGMLG